MHIPEEILHGNKTLLTEKTLHEIINHLEQLKKHSSSSFTEDLNIVIKVLSNKSILSELGLYLQ
jgi:hypothetical protein